MSQPWVWDVDRILVRIPIVEFPIYWYGFLFALGAYIAQKPFYQFLKRYKQLRPDLIQNGIIKLIIAVIIGARLGDLFFYQSLSSYWHHPLDLLNLRQGGLSSHGGFVGFVTALYWLSKSWKISFFDLLNGLIPSVGILAAFIRLGNFFNQEILGIPYNGWMAVLFTHPLDGGVLCSRHPVQLYEAFAYGLLAIGFRKFKTPSLPRVGKALVLFFSARFLLEFFKEEQSAHFSNSPLKMGALLSLPLILLGIVLWVRAKGDTRNLDQRS